MRASRFRLPPRRRVCPSTWWERWSGLLMSTAYDSFFHQNVELPMNPPVKTKKKPFLEPKSKWKKKKEAAVAVLRPPTNGLLVPELVPVAHDTLRARMTLINGATKLLKILPVKVCRYCPAVHVGPVGHQIASCQGPHNGRRRGRHDWIDGNIDDVLPQNHVFHLSDRLGKVISHDDRYKIKKVPAVVELCIQAGVDILDYPTKRRTEPVVMIDTKIVEFDDLEDHHANLRASRVESRFNEMSLIEFGSIDHSEESPLHGEALSVLADKTLQAWFAVRDGAQKLMSKYYVQVCGYCPQLHVGPKGTKTCDCFAYKHQMRAGHHYWQEASIDNLVPPIYVWHLRDRCGPALLTELRVFYGATPAIVELCMQAGAPIPEQCKPMMRLDVVIPDLDELEKVV